MEAAFAKLRTIVAVAATIVVGAVLIQSVAQASGEPARAPIQCPPYC